MERKACPKPTKQKKVKVAESTVLKLWREVVIAQARNQCEYPNCTVKWTQLHPHHYFGRGHKSVKYDPINGISLCHIHHANGNQAAHLDPDWKEVWLKSGKRPEWWLRELTERKNKVVKDNDEYRAIWKDHLKKELERLNETK